MLESVTTRRELHKFSWMGIFTLVFIALVANAIAQPLAFRPPAVPLIAMDPYMSVILLQLFI